MKILLIYTFFSFLMLTGFAQVIKNGTYIGYERNPTCWNRSWCLVIHDTSVAEKKTKWYYQVTIVVSNDTVYIQKVPIYFYSTPDSIPSIDRTHQPNYTYTARIFNSSEHGLRINGFITGCNQCPRRGDGIPRYTSIGYKVKKRGINLFLSTETEENIFFEYQNEAL